MKRTIVFLSLVIGAIGLVQCGDDETSPAGAGGSILGDSGTGGKSDAAVGVGGSRAGAGGTSVDAAPADGSAGGTLTPGAGGSAGTDAGGIDGATPGVGGNLQDSGPDARRTDAEAGPNCPTQQPVDNTDCSTSSQAECPPYGTVTCRCRGRDGKWWCVDTSQAADAGCPSTQPTQGQACRQEGLSCNFAAQTCRCPTGTGATGQRWQCTASEAGTDAAPDVVPQSDAAADATPDVVSTPDAEADAADAQAD